MLHLEDRQKGDNHCECGQYHGGAHSASRIPPATFDFDLHHLSTVGEVVVPGAHEGETGVMVPKERESICVTNISTLQRAY